MVSKSLYGMKDITRKFCEKKSKHAQGYCKYNPNIYNNIVILIIIVL